MQFKLLHKIPETIRRRIRNILLLCGSFILLGMTMQLLNSSGNIGSDNNTFDQAYKIFPVPFPDTLSFADERVPMNHLGVKESLEQEMLVNTYWQSQALLMLKRAHRYFPMIERILKKNGIPDDFKYLALAESGFSYKVSGVGASGFWQFMKPTAVK